MGHTLLGANMISSFNQQPSYDIYSQIGKLCLLQIKYFDMKEIVLVAESWKYQV